MLITRTPLVFTAFLLTSGCTAKQLGLPRTEQAVAAPDSSAWAEVRNHPSFDPPDQSLQIRLHSGEVVRLVRLAPDQDWCNAAVWAPDGSRVAFLVQDATAYVYDLATRRLIATDLVDKGGAYPSENIARELTFSTDGAQLSLLPCKRRGGSCGLRVAIPVPAPAADELGPWRRLS